MRMARRFLPWVGIVLVLVIAILGVRAIVAAFTENQNAKATATLAAAMQDADAVTALQKASETLDGHHAALARLIAFQRMDVEQQKTEGLLLLDRLAADDAAPQEWRHFAALAATKARIAFGAKMTDAEALLTMLTPAAEDKTSPWRTASRIQMALIKSEMLRDPKAALATLESIDTSQMDSTLAEQVEAMRLHYQAQSLDPSSDRKAEAQ